MYLDNKTEALGEFLVFAQVTMSRVTGFMRRNQGEHVASLELCPGGKMKILPS